MLIETNRFIVRVAADVWVSPLSKGSVFCCIDICSVDTRALQPEERFTILSCVCSVFVDQPHQGVRRPNAIVADGVKYLGDSVRSVGRLLVILKASNAASNFSMMAVEDVIVGVS